MPVGEQTKVGAPRFEWEARLLRLLDDAGVEYETLDHAKVRNIADVERALDIDASAMAKAIICLIRTLGKAGERDRQVVFVLPESLKLDMEKVGKLLGRSRRQWRFATQKEVKATWGLEIGGVPGFGYGEGVTVYMDRRLVEGDVIYCGVGNPGRSLRMKVEDLRRVSSAEICDIAEEVRP